MFLLYLTFLILQWVDTYGEDNYDYSPLVKYKNHLPMNLSESNPVEVSEECTLFVKLLSKVLTNPKSKSKVQVQV